jgi:predicted metal-dependent hydrolase
MPLVLRRALQVVVGLLVGLALAEGLFWFRDDGAFPHLNVYVEDAKLGVRLRPGGSQRVAFAGNPVTRVRINADGLRGPELPPPSPGEVLVLGDSQVFGLGVEEGETFSAQLDALLPEARVVNAGVPTHGPAEYVALLEELVPRRKPAVVVLTFNLVNDLFEAERPNTERHRVWDGWAVRSETAPADVTSFPGRELLFRESHAVFALRRLLHARTPGADERGFASEGTWQDVLGAAKTAEQARTEADQETRRRALARQEALWGMDLKRSSMKRQLDQTLIPLMPELVEQLQAEGVLQEREAQEALEGAQPGPGDIVRSPYAESSRAIRRTARELRVGARLRAKLEKALVSDAVVVEDAESVSRVRALLGEREEVDRSYRALKATPAEVVHSFSPLRPWMERARAVCDAHGARLVVLALPMDVQVSAEEWKKYGEEPLDMKETLVLLDDIVATARWLGVSALDLTPALARAEPGAFLHGDIHMTPKGHRAVAEALVATLAEPPPPRIPGPGLPPGRSRVPLAREWAALQEITVKGSTRASCETYQLREWLRVTCREQSVRSSPTGVRVVSGGRGEALTLSVDGFTSLVAPVLEGDVLVADFSWTDRTQRLEFHGASGGVRQFLAAGPPPQARPEPSAHARRLCECGRDDTGERCPDLFGTEAQACFDTYSACHELLGCVAGDIDWRPRCPEGSANAGATGHCFPLCGPGRPCASGTCTPWEGGHVCL